MKSLSRKINNFLNENSLFPSRFLYLSILFTLFVVKPKTVEAWGGRGHDTICEAAAYLVQEKELKTFLQARPHVMGHLCNLPDIQWRNEGGDSKSAGDPAHYINAEVIGMTPKTITLDLEKLKKDFTGKTNPQNPDEKIFSVTRQLGSVYWRVDQFMRILANLKSDFANAAIPANKSEEQNDDLPFNKATYHFLTHAGIMGHFVADTAQPFHNTSDYDGYDSGHGGIHSFYEEALVSHLEGDLLTKILKTARGLKKQEWEKGSTLEKMKAFSIAAYTDIGKLKKLDQVVKKSELKTEKGMKIKTAAERKDPSTLAKKFEPLIVTHMARSAHLLANLWDEAYRSVGKPQLSAYKSYKYPFKVDFIYPDYDDSKK